ncbi:DUF262 domain-containing protein [Metabacillus fastidiosus]|uniref:DUF262 domain-containing protein n=1 Tax=Metabacillus fastidiosus TaxID=1458 RepID=UPI0008241500|nr:DUF262 domain-containing protein [Metabacillus fastidiosus]MED4461845.1 DUF262 domain-containing protein [Metabacillus fastidiosus]
MPVHRSGPVPPFFEYITGYALLPTTVAPNQAITGLLTGQFQWVEIPRYQRGISWEVEEVEEFLNSSSVLLGNVILASFSRNTNQFQLLPQSFNTYCILVDGLQRFTVGTILLSVLHDLVLTPTNPRFPTEAVYFNSLSARVAPLAPIYLHNDYEFRNHPRTAISSQYIRLREDIETYVLGQIQSSNVTTFAGNLVNTFLSRQIAVDIYFNFRNSLEIMSTFLGINTVRVDLGPVDLLRAFIIEQGTSAGWSALDIDDVENEFTEIFTTNEKPDRNLLPFVSTVLKALGEGNGSRVFPSWGTNLSKDEVDNFLQFVLGFKNQIDANNGNSNSYLREIKECGSIPLAILMSYYYIRIIHHGQSNPSFLNGGSQENAELQRFLIACYRGILDGRITRTRVYAENIINGTQTASLSDIANSLSHYFVSLSIDQQLDDQWLRTVLNKVDIKKAKRVFNALLLPPKAAGYGVPPFVPFKYGRSARDFHVDHLIPDRLLVRNTPGASEGQTIRNFAPLPANLNTVAKATSCSAKLAPQGIYYNYINSSIHPVHPYAQWLVQHHSVTIPSTDLDRQELLETNRTPDVGTDRINELVIQLLTKI